MTQQDSSSQTRRQQLSFKLFGENAKRISEMIEGGKTPAAAFNVRVVEGRTVVDVVVS